MNVPPSFESAPQYQAPRPQKSNVPRVLLLIFLFVCVPCVLVVFFGARMLGGVMKEGVGLVGCTFSVTSARDAMLDYAKDHNGKLPPMEKWQNAIFPYYQKHMKGVTEDMKDAPGFMKDMLDIDRMKDPNKQFGCRDGDTKTSTFVYNSNIAGKVAAEVQKTADTMWIFESSDPGVSVSKPAPEKLDHSKAPKVMGEVRGWIWIKGEGDALLRDREFSEGNIKVRIDEEKAKRAEKEAAKAEGK